MSKEKLKPSPFFQNIIELYRKVEGDKKIDLQAEVGTELFLPEDENVVQSLVNKAAGIGEGIELIRKAEAGFPQYDLWETLSPYKLVVVSTLLELEEVDTTTLSRTLEMRLGSDYIEELYELAWKELSGEFELASS